MMFVFFFLIACIIGGVAAQAQLLRCLLHDGMEKALAAGPSEYLVWHGLTGDGRFTVRLYQNDDTGTWTATAQKAKLPECINGMGIAGTKLPFREPPPEYDADATLR